MAKQDQASDEEDKHSKQAEFVLPLRYRRAYCNS